MPKILLILMLINIIIIMSIKQGFSESKVSLGLDNSTIIKNSKGINYIKKLIFDENNTFRVSRKGLSFDLDKTTNYNLYMNLSQNKKLSIVLSF
ncbi:MAG: hypothetical protein OEV44_10390 [Spirochaetota bacterium]|nr:hypothetical protein [Spirochaetota bacterium]